VSGIHDYWLFLLTGVLLNLTPGQDTLFIIGRSLTGGLRAGIAAACGIAVGSLGHTLAAALGLSLLQSSSCWGPSISSIWVRGCSSPAAHRQPPLPRSARRRRVPPSCRAFSPTC
jgi:hypothetical protein